MSDPPVRNGSPPYTPIRTNHTSSESAERDGREAEDLTRAPERHVGAGRARAGVDEEPEQEVADEPVEAAGDERDDGEGQAVELEVVECVRERIRPDHAGDSREEDDREQRLGARVVVVLAERGEHLGRTPQDEQRPLPPHPLHGRELGGETDRDDGD